MEKNEKEIQWEKNWFLIQDTQSKSSAVVTGLRNSAPNSVQNDERDEKRMSAPPTRLASEFGSKTTGRGKKKVWGQFPIRCPCEIRASFFSFFLESASLFSAYPALVVRREISIP